MKEKPKTARVVPSHYMYANKVVTILDDYGTICRIEFYSNYEKKFKKDIIGKDELIFFEL